MSAADNKALVLSWLQAGPSSDAGRSMLSQDFRWHIPKGMAELMNGGSAVVHGPDALLELSAIDKAVYAGGETTFEMVYVIAEGDWVALQANIGARSHEGDEYSNTEVFFFFCKDGMTAEVGKTPPTNNGATPSSGAPSGAGGGEAGLGGPRGHEEWKRGSIMTDSEPWIAQSRAELLAGVQSRVVVDPGDARSGSVFERVTIDGQPYFAKTLGYHTDWIMRITGDRDLRTLKIWRAGIMRDVPPEIDHTVVGMAADGEGEDALLTILMRDVGEHLFPEGDATISLEAHLGLVDGLAALSARYWGWSDDIGLTTLEERLRFFAPDNIAAEAAVADPPLPVRVATQGWPRLAERAPALSELRHCDPRRARRSPTRCVPRPRRSCRATGRWATSAVIRMAARSCSIGPIRDRARSCGISPGISR